MKTPPLPMIMMVTLMTFCINVLFGILIARATARAILNQDTTAFMRVIILNDQLDRIRNVVVNEVASWGTVPE